MRKKKRQDADFNLDRDAWLDAEDNIKDFDRFCRFLAGLVETRDKLSKRQLFKMLGGKKLFQEHVTAAVSRYKTRNRETVSIHGMIAYAYFHLEYLLWNKQR
jgi:hypothetical protein